MSTANYYNFDTMLDSVVATVVRRFISNCQQQQFFHLQFTPTHIKDYHLNAFSKNFFVWTHLDKIIRSTADSTATIAIAIDDRTFGTGESWIKYGAGPEAKDSDGKIYQESNSRLVTRNLQATLRNHLYTYLMELSKYHAAKPQVGLGNLAEPTFTVNDIRTFLYGRLLEIQPAWNDPAMTHVLVDKTFQLDLIEIYSKAYYAHLTGQTRFQGVTHGQLEPLFERLKKMFGDPFGG